MWYLTSILLTLNQILNKNHLVMLITDVMELYSFITVFISELFLYLKA